MEATTIPTFCIEKQDCLAILETGKKTPPVHLVARNIPFVIHLSSSFDLSKYCPKAILIYDGANYEEDKEVEALKTSTLEITSHVNETGFTAAVDTKIGVLSSQHEGSFFRVKFFVQDPNGATLFDYTEPIKVISKRNQVKKILERREKQTEAKTVKLSTPTSPVEPPTPSTSLKRPASELTETIERLEQQQQAQYEMIQILLQNKERSDEENEFAVAFQNFMNAYKNLPIEERARKIRKVMGAENVQEDLHEFIGSMVAAQRSLEAGTKNNGTEDPNVLMELLVSNDDQGNGSGGDVCAHKKALEKLEDELYNNFLEEDER
jgi:hypothetical protein